MEKNEVKQSGPKESKELALHYMKTLVEVARESFLILDADLVVVSANPMFYKTFQVSAEQTEGKSLYDLGNGQWNIPQLRSLLQDVLPQKKLVTNYEVKHVFQAIGEKTMLLNARQIDSVQLIVLAIEDISERKLLEEKLADRAKVLEVKIAERTRELTDRVKELELLNKTMVGREIKMTELKKEIESLKKLIKNGNGNHENGR
jgi:two-component system CheB/CheR fusion protein